MNHIIFSKFLFASLFLCFSFSNAQVKVKNNNKQNNTRIKNNKKRVVISKPNRPRIIKKRPSYNRSGYVWIAGHWKWNWWKKRYVWKKGKWKRVKKNHFWVPGYWQETPNGFYWVEGYWQLR